MTLSVCTNRRAPDPDAVAGFFTGCGLATRAGCTCGRAVEATTPEDPQADQLRDLIAGGWSQDQACRLLWGPKPPDFPTVLEAAGVAARGFVLTSLSSRLPWLRLPEAQEAS